MFSGLLTGLLGKQVQVTLETTRGKVVDAKEIDVIYLIVDALLPYKFTLRRPIINALEAVVSTLYIVIKYPLPKG